MSDQPHCSWRNSDENRIWQKLTLSCNAREQQTPSGARRFWLDARTIDVCACMVACVSVRWREHGTWLLHKCTDVFTQITTSQSTRSRSSDMDMFNLSACRHSEQQSRPLGVCRSANTHVRSLTHHIHKNELIESDVCVHASMHARTPFTNTYRLPLTVKLLKYDKDIIRILIALMVAIVVLTFPWYPHSNAVYYFHPVNNYIKYLWNVSVPPS